MNIVNIYPKSNHSLPKMVINALLSSKCRKSHLHAFVIKSTRVPESGWGGSSQYWICQDFESSCFGKSFFLCSPQWQSFHIQMVFFPKKSILIQTSFTWKLCWCWFWKECFQLVLIQARLFYERARAFCNKVHDAIEGRNRCMNSMMHDAQT